MRTTILASVLGGVLGLSAFGASVAAQEPNAFGSTQSFGFATTYSPNSSHIFLGDAERRRVWTLGVDYERPLEQGEWFRFAFEASVIPLYEETDPTLTGTVFTLNGVTILTTVPATRVTHVNNLPISSVVIGNGPPIPVYALFGRQDSHAAAITPLGARVNAMPHWRVQPSFALDLGFVVSPGDIPIDHSDQFNFLFALGPGLEFFADHKTSWRIEYLYRHMSNAGEGSQNPGVDQGVIRLTVNRHR